MKETIHLIEEIGEVSRVLLHKETKRGTFANNTDPGNIEDEVADIFWQTLKLASYLKIDLNQAFINKLEKNRNKSKTNTIKPPDKGVGGLKKTP